MGIVTVTRVFGPGSETVMKISFEGERLCGNGRFSNVYSAMMSVPQSMQVAVKNVWEEKDRPPLVGVHPEIQILSQLNHPNVISLLYHYTRSLEGNRLHCLVLEYLPEDFQRIRDKGVRFDLVDAKLFAFQLFVALGYLQEKNVIHLDIKPANLLINHEAGILKLADFGNAQMLSGKEAEQTNPYQVTRFYRAPEVVFSTKFFTTAIDVWSAACCTYEFVSGRVLFKGRSAGDQLKLLLECFGYPTEEEIKVMRISRPRIGRPTPKGVEKFAGVDFPKEALDLLQALLIVNPKKRPTAKECVKMAFFEELKKKETKRQNGAPFPGSLRGKRSEMEFW